MKQGLPAKAAALLVIVDLFPFRNHFNESQKEPRRSEKTLFGAAKVVKGFCFLQIIFWGGVCQQTQFT